MFTKAGILLTSPKGLVDINKPLPRGREAYFDIPEEELKGTVLDPALAEQGGRIPLAGGALVYIPDVVNEVLPFIPAAASPNWVSRLLPKGQEHRVFTIKPRQYAYIPRWTNESFDLRSGMRVLTPLQSAANSLVQSREGELRARNSTSRGVPQIYQRAFANYLQAIKAELFRKGGFLDCLVASVLPFTARGVLTNDTQVRPNEVRIPPSVVRKWLSYPNFRETLGIDDRQDIYALDGKRVLVGRQPSHRYTNLFSMRMRVGPPPLKSFGINPLVVNLFDGDYDGDTVWLWMPISAPARADLQKLKVERLFPLSEPGKELKGVKLSEDPMKFSSEARDVFKVFTEGPYLGRSCTWRDLVGRPGGTGYYDDLTKEQRKEFSVWATGESIDDYPSHVQAMCDYRIIKGGVARAGGLSNSFMNLCLAFVWSWQDQEKAEKVMRTVADVKHTLCQEMLDAKHGEKDEDDLEVLSKMFYRSPDCPYDTKDEYKEFMKTAGLPEAGSNFIVDVFFSYADPPENINHLLADVNPFFMLTRTQASIPMLDKFVELSKKKETSLHSMFMCREKKDHEVQ